MSYQGPKLYKRGNVWWARVGGKRVSTGARDRRAAELSARNLERRAADPTYRAASETTLGEALRRWLGDRRVAGRSDATLAYYRGKAGPLVRLLGSETPLARLTREAVRGYVAAREAEGAKPHTVHKELGALRSCLRWARAEGLWAGEPAALLPSGYSPRYAPRRAYLTPDQAWALVYHLEPERGAHVAWLVGTACRWGESVRAERGDVDQHAKTVRVRGTKTACSAATVPIVSVAEPFVRWALERAPGGEVGRLFAPWGNRLRDLARACERAGVPTVTPNDLRRSLPSWCRQAGAPLDLVADVLRHTDATMARRVYGVPDPVATGAAIDRHFEASGGVPKPYRRRRVGWRLWRRWRARIRLKQAV